MLRFQNDLKKVGLSDKEAAVYLAILGLSSGTVQQIARKAGVARATTYLVLDALLEMGLVTRFEEEGTTIFVAEDPAHLEHLVVRQEEEADKSRLALKDFLPKLNAFVKKSEDQPVVRYFDGVEGIKAIRSELSMHAQAGEEWFQLTPVDYLQKLFGKEDFTYSKQRKAKRIKSKAIVATDDVQLQDNLRNTEEKKWAERRIVSKKQYNSPSGLTITPRRTVVGVFSDHPGGVVIESEVVAEMMRELFLMAWNNIDNK